MAKWKIQNLTLVFFATFGPPSWQADEDRLNGEDWYNGRFFVDLAQKLERSKFDFLFFEDTSTVSSAVGGKMDADLRFNIYSPKHDPLALLPMLAGATEKIGLIATASTTFYPPWILARQLSTIDNLSNGRIGWNVVTSGEKTAGQNFGMDDLPPHSVRYDMAGEYLDLTKKLWAAWEPDALVKDLENNTYVDPSKVKFVNHEGAHFKVRGPLNVLPSPQGHPVIVQAGSSPRGRDFAAQHAELIFAPAEGGAAGMKAYRDDIRERAKKFGRNPDDIKVIFAGFIAFTPDDYDPNQPQEFSDEQVDYAMAWCSATFNLDLSQFPLNEPLPLDLPPSGHTGLFEEMIEMCKEGKTLREVVMAIRMGAGGGGFFGTPEEVAAEMVNTMNEVGGDGFMIISSNVLTKNYLDKVLNRLVPALRNASAIRTEYPGKTLRDNIKNIV